MHASNRVREVIARGAAHLPADRAALTAGSSSATTATSRRRWSQRFRDAGLSHLTAVSGPERRAAAGGGRPAAAAAAPGRPVGGHDRPDRVVRRADARRAIRAPRRRDGRAGGDRVRARPPGRAAAPARRRRRSGCCSSTRCSPGRSGSGCRSGRRPASCSGRPHLAPRLGRLGPLALPVAVTLGAQCGVVVPSLLVFGRLSLTGTVANLVAVPVAGLVMLYGLPACLVAGTRADRRPDRDGAGRLGGVVGRRRRHGRRGRRAGAAVVVARLGGARGSRRLAGAALAHPSAMMAARCPCTC